MFHSPKRRSRWVYSQNVHSRSGYNVFESCLFSNRHEHVLDCHTQARTWLHGGATQTKPLSQPSATRQNNFYLATIFPKILKIFNKLIIKNKPTTTKKLQKETRIVKENYPQERSSHPWDAHIPQTPSMHRKREREFCIYLFIYLTFVCKNEFMRFKKKQALEKQRGSFLIFITSGSQDDSIGISSDHVNDSECVDVASNVHVHVGGRQRTRN